MKMLDSKVQLPAYSLVEEVEKMPGDLELTY